MSKPFYITTPLYYVNAPPSWGAYTTIVADALRRHKQMLGIDVFLTTGTDEHGQKIERSAKAKGLSPKQLADSVADQYKQLWQQMGIEYATIWTTIENSNATYMKETKRLLEENGIRLLNIGILDLHCDPTLTLGLPGFGEKVEQYKAYLRALGEAGIRYTTYAHMANIKMLPYYQTGMAPTRGGTMTREFDVEKARHLPLSHDREYSDDEIKAAIPNLCRCGVYPRLLRAVQRASRVARRAERISAAPPPGIDPLDAATAVPAMRAPRE